MKLLLAASSLNAVSRFVRKYSFKKTLCLKEKVFFKRKFVIYIIKYMGNGEKHIWGCSQKNCTKTYLGKILNKEWIQIDDHYSQDYMMQRSARQVYEMEEWGKKKPFT